MGLISGWCLVDVLDCGLTAVSLQTEDEDGGPSSQDLSLIFTSLVLKGKDEPEPTDGLLFRAEPALVSPNWSLDMNERVHEDASKSNRSK